MKRQCHQQPWAVYAVGFLCASATGLTAARTFIAVYG
jgi:hypothetical protein